MRGREGNSPDQTVDSPQQAEPFSTPALKIRSSNLQLAMSTKTQKGSFGLSFIPVEELSEGVVNGTNAEGSGWCQAALVVPAPQNLGLQEEMSAQRGAGHTVGRSGAGIQAFSFLGKENKFTLPENEIEKPNNMSDFCYLGFGSYLIWLLG